MKRTISAILVFIMIVSATICFATESESTQSPVWRQYYVAKTGNDSNDGVNKPFATIERAVEEVRKVSPQMQGDIVVNVEEGTYTFDETLVMSPEDSGKNGYKIIYKGNNYPTFSGGFVVEGFEPSTRDERFWEVKIEDVEDVYGMYVNTKRAFVANSNYRISAKDVFDDPKTPEKNDGLYISNQDISEYKQADRVELWYTANWTFTKARVNSISRDIASDDRYVVRMVQPDWNTYFASTTNYPDRFDMFIVSNAYELLDTPGEYYYDKETEKLYYYPRVDEDMKTAEVIIPRIDTLIKIQGHGIENQVKNITFEGIRFAYTSNSTLESTRFYMSKQGVNIPDYTQNALHNIPTLLSTVEINHTDGINFEKNIFLGCGVVGINMIHGVFNTKINANVFADIGDTAIAYGHITHHDSALGRDGVGDAPKPNAKLDLTTGSLISASMPVNISALRYEWYYQPKFSYGAPLFITEEEFGYKSVNEYDAAPGTWTGDPKASDTGEKQWVKFDFREKYSVDKIMVAFNPISVKKNQKNKYEVLLSNDKNFEDESTIVVAVQNDDPSDIVSYNVDSTEKYRYCMLRTTEPKEFAVTRVAVLSTDIKPYTNAVRNVNCDITNNYITRTGQGNGVIGSGSSINAYGYDEGMRLVHNEFYNLPYSATGIGYGWSDQMMGGRNNYMGYNYFHDLNKTLHDGGPIYLMSNQEGFIGEKNYSEKMIVSNGGIYPDKGSADMLFRENVFVDLQRPIYMWVGSEFVMNKVHTTYSTASKIRTENTEDLIEYPIVVRYGDLPPAAEKIKEEAGIIEEYQYIKDLVPDFDIYGFDERFNFFNPRHTTQGLRTLVDDFIPEGISNILKEGKFGILFGQYPESVKERLSEYKDIVVSGAAPDYVKKADLNVGVREYLREHAKVRRLEADEMLEFCKTELEKAKETCIFDNAAQAAKASKSQKTKAVGTYTKTDIAEFEKAVQNAEAANKEDKVQAAFDLEAAYNKFFRSILGGGFEAASLKGMQSSDIDYNTHTVTFYVYPEDDLTGKTPELTFLSSKNYFGKVVDDKIDLVKGFEMPIYCDVLKTYTNWTIKAVEYKEESGEFTSAFSDKEFKVEVSEGTLLMPSQTVYMKQEYADGKGEINFKPSVVNKSFKLTAVFGASVCSELVRNSTDSRYDRMEIEMTESKVTLYKVVAGAKQKICEMRSNINKNAYNTIKYVTNTHNEVCTLNVYVNGKKMDEVIIPETYADGYMGIFTDKLPVYVK